MIHLVQMPWCSVTQPSLALGLIRAQLLEAGLATRTFHLNMEFGSRIGWEAYERIALLRWERVQVGEWLFTGAAWREEASTPEEFFASAGDELDPLPAFGDRRVWLTRIRDEVVPAFLEDAVDLLAEAGEPRVVGFTSAFFQNLPALAMARAVKEAWPDCTIVFGGSNIHDEMGRELIAKVPWIDVVSLGEADDVIVPLFRALLDGRPPSGLQGIVYRDRDTAELVGEAPRPVPAAVLQTLPHPDFDDYIDGAAEYGLLYRPEWLNRAFLPFEGARGCWWGVKHHCTFCGLDNAKFTFRERTGDRVYDQLKSLADRYPLRRFHCADLILATGYFDTLLPRLEAEPIAEKFSLFYELKPNMTREQVKALADARILFCQPGIESLNTHLLQLMRKGISGIQNVAFLRETRRYGVVPMWNLLMGISGERPEDFVQSADWIGRITHLQPPMGATRSIEMQRYSPYFTDPKWAGEKVPRAWYRPLYPDRFDLGEVAYYFDGDFHDILGPDEWAPMVEACRAWIHMWATWDEVPRLTERHLANGAIELFDNRSGEPLGWTLEPLQGAVYRAIDRPAGLRAARAAVHAAGLGPADDAALRQILDGFVAAGLAVSEGNTYLALALPDDIPPIDRATRAATYQPDPGHEELGRA